MDKYKKKKKQIISVNCKKQIQKKTKQKKNKIRQNNYPHLEF